MMSRMGCCRRHMQNDQELAKEHRELRRRLADECIRNMGCVFIPCLVAHSVWIAVQSDDPREEQRFLLDTPLLPMIVCMVAVTLLQVEPQLLTTKTLDRLNVLFSCLFIWKYAVVTKPWFDYNVAWMTPCRLAGSSPWCSSSSLCMR